MLMYYVSCMFQVDAFGEDVSFDLGAEHKVKLEARLHLLEEGNLRRLSGTGKVKAKFEKYHAQSQVQSYETAHDNTLPVAGAKKRKLIEEVSEEPETPKQKAKKAKQEEEVETPGPSSEKKKKKKDKSVVVEEEEAVEEETPKSEKKKKKKSKADETMEVEEAVEEPVSEKKKKKKKKQDDE